MVDELSSLQARVERLEAAVGEVRDRLRNCIRIAGRPQDSIALARGVAESLAKRILEGAGIKPPAMLDACLRELERPEVMSRGLVPSEIISLLHVVRVLGKKAVHDAARIRLSAADVQLVLQSVLRVVEWYFAEFERGPRLPRLFAPAGGPQRGAHTPPVGQTLAERRRSVYEELWRRLEEAHVKIRTEEVERPEFSLLLRDVNTYILQNSAYLGDDVHGLANDYLSLLLEAREQVADAGADDVGRALSDTAPIPAAALERAGKLRDVLARAEAVRAELLGKVREALGDRGPPHARGKRWWKFW